MRKINGSHGKGSDLSRGVWESTETNHDSDEIQPRSSTRVIEQLQALDLLEIRLSEQRENYYAHARSGNHSSELQRRIFERQIGQIHSPDPIVDDSELRFASSRVLNRSPDKAIYRQLPTLDVDLPSVVERKVSKQVDPSWVRSLQTSKPEIRDL
eukprot:TRINITY_DN2006_c0_g1_i22.p1 TRINITY_DN2006_c0_g1~~TRINITY_DN2006_c0_g1_i22.p1  ORF type:complete len:155 (-),score=35.79 TRINITY_DN2006_c0_g1_i22:149-613(-)